MAVSIEIRTVVTSVVSGIGSQASCATPVCRSYGPVLLTTTPTLPETEAAICRPATAQGGR